MRNTVAAPQPIKEKSFSGERAYLSNMHEAPIDTEQGRFRCVEAAYQATKSLNFSALYNINGFEAKKLGKRFPITNPDYSKFKLIDMEWLVRYKFQQHAELEK